MQETPPSPMVLRYFLALFLAVTVLAGWLLWPFISILVLSLLLTRLFRPVYARINRILGQALSSLLTCLLILLLVFIPAVFFATSLSKEAMQLYQSGKLAELAEMVLDLQSSQFIVRILEVLASFGINFEPETVHNAFSDFAKSMAITMYDLAGSWAANLLLVTAYFFLMLITIFFLLIDQQRLIDFVLKLSPLPDDQQHLLLKKFGEIAGAVLVGNSICGGIQGLIGGLLFALCDLGPPVLWGGIMAILAFLPVFGIGLVLIPVSLILFLEGSTGMGIFVLIFYMILSFSVEYALKPKLVGAQVRMHTLLAFFSIIGGLQLFGFMGIIYGPLIITAFLTLAEIYQVSYDKYVKVVGS